MELASVELSKVLSRPNSPRHCKRLLDLKNPRLGAISPEAFRFSTRLQAVLAILCVNELRF